MARLDASGPTVMFVASLASCLGDRRSGRLLRAFAREARADAAAGLPERVGRLGQEPGEVVAGSAISI